MKKLFLMFAVLVSFAANSFAQDAQVKDPIEQKQKGKDKMRPHPKGDNPMKSLNLNDEQKTNMKNINNEFQGKMKAIRTDKSLSKEQKMAQLKALNEEHNNKMKGLLSAEQYTKWSGAKQNRIENAKEKHGKGKHGGKKGNPTPEATPAPQKN